MATKKRKSKKKNSQAHTSWIWNLLSIEDTRARALRCLLFVFVACAIAAGIHVGFNHLEADVHSLAIYDRPLALEWENLPDWLQMQDNRHILEKLTEQINLAASDRMLDPNLAERLGHALTASGVGWVKKVERITVRPDAVVTVLCQFRRPTAWVQYGQFCYLVDTEGVRLPGRYHASECMDGVLFVVDGVAKAPPPIGDAWPGADLNAGLKLAGLLTDEPFRHQITRILVANHGGRQNRNRPHLELATDRDASRVWWGRPPDEEFGTEISASQKITLLETLYRQWGRVDMNRAYVNIMTWPDRITMPAAAPPPKPARRLLRG